LSNYILNIVCRCELEYSKFYHSLKDNFAKKDKPAGTEKPPKTT